jgi:hypothetical protein
MITIKYSIKDCKNGRNGQNAGNIWTWTAPTPHPTKFNIVTLNETTTKIQSK